MRVTNETTPKLSVGADVFHSQVEDGEFWGVPVEYFTVESGEVYLDSVVAEKLEWTVDEQLPSTVNIAAVAQTIEVNGMTLYIQPGFFCSYIEPSEIR